MNKEAIYAIKKTSSGLGFMLFISSASMYILTLIISVFLYNRLDTSSILLLNIVISIISLFLVSFFYCWFSKTDLGEVIKVKWVKLELALPLIFIAIAISFTADYLTDIIQNNFSIFGIKNSVDLSTESSTPFESFLNIVSVCVIPALVEEFLFRGIVLGKLRFFGESFALFMSSMLFALMHGNIIQIPFAFIVGLSLAFITIKTNSILPCIIVHFLINFRSVFVSILLDNNLVAENILNNVYLIILFVLFVMGILSAAILSKRKNFFKTEEKAEYPFRTTFRASIFSIGMIFFLIHCLTTTLQTLSISFLPDSLFSGF